MNKRTTLLFAVFLAVTVTFGQTPETLNYQGIARDAGGDALANQSIAIAFVIHENSILGTSVFTETHTVTTDDNGLFTLDIGSGVVLVGTKLSDIPWESKSFFLEVLMDAAGGTNYLQVGVQQLLSVPYALHAKTAESIAGVGLPDPLLPVPIAYQGDTLFVAPLDGPADINHTSAISSCNSLVVGGYSDWRLPSISELNALYKQSYLVTGLDESPNYKYWSASFDANGDVYTRRMDYGGPDPDEPTTMTGHRVRCVRQNP